MSDRTRGESLVHPVWYVHIFLWTNGRMEEFSKREIRRNAARRKKRKSERSVGCGLVVQVNAGSCRLIFGLVSSERETNERNLGYSRVFTGS